MTASQPMSSGGRKQAALEFLRLATSGHAREAFEKYAAPEFHHHNPWFAGDANSLMTAMDDNAAKNPENVLDVQRAIEDGTLVAVHSRVHHKPGDLGAAVVHIFRFNGDRIVELWDVGQPVPAESPNMYGMF